MSVDSNHTRTNMDGYPSSEVNDAALAIATCAIQKHPVHYKDVLVILKVEETLFRAEKSLLCQFDIFRDMFESASAHLKDREEGTTDENPIVLQGLTAVEMESLLHGVPEVDPQQWKAVVRLATMWEHEQLRQFAIGKIDELNMSSIELFDIGTKSRVGKWLKPALVEMCLRPSPLGLDEGKRLGIRFFVELTKIREKCLTTTRIGSCCPACNRTYKGSCSSCGNTYDHRNCRRNGGGFSYYGPPRHISSNYCNCDNDMDLQKREIANNMVQILIDSGLPPLLEDTSGRVSGG
ncbi:hypothetical protein FRC02_012338 [Tulasnella sp. 418]|nr:hypothetical protein FRC02_012338 [Tulasnella sp. 418]